MTDRTSSRPRWLVPATVVGVLALGVVLALTQPWLKFVDEVADEQLPQAAAPAVAEDAEDAEDADGTDATEPAADDQPAATPTPDTADEPEPTNEATPTPTGPVVLAEGTFISRDHPTTGDVAIVQLEDGSRVLTIEGLETDNGPDLYVYVDDTAADGPEDEFDDGIDLGRLRANIGDLVYELPDDLDLDGIVSVAIWCDRFSSLFGAADLAWS